MAYIGKQPVVGNFQVCDAISVVNGQAAYTMQVASTNVEPENANHMLVSLNGVLQKPGSSFTISGATITFASNLVTNDVIDFIILLGDTLNVGTPSDDSVGAAQVKNDLISGLTELTSAPASTDEFLVSDAGTLKRIDASLVGSQDYVKLSSTTPSAANTFSIDGFFTSDYDVYKIYVIGVSGSSMSNTRVSMRVNVSGTAQTGSNYYHHVNIASGTSVNGNWSNSSSGTDSDIGYAHNSSGSTAQGQFEFTIFRPLAADKTAILNDGIAADNGSTWGRYSGFTVWNVATAISGITLGVGDFGSGNLEADRILVYGLKI